MSESPSKTEADKWRVRDVEKNTTLSFESEEAARERKEHAENSLGIEVELLPPEGEPIEKPQNGSDSIPEKEAVGHPEKEGRADGGSVGVDAYDKLEWEHEPFRVTIDITITPLGEPDE